MLTRFKTITFFSLVITASRVDAAEICGNSVDDDGDGLADEGCYPTLTTGQCESPLSCGDTGMVSPSTGSLHYSLPPDVAPKVPFGPGIGLRRFYLSQFAPSAASPPAFQAAGAKADGTGSVSPSWPAHQAGDIALLIVESAGTEPATLSSAQGFASVSGSPQGDNVDINGSVLTVWWKRAASSSELAPTVADPGNHVYAKIITFRNAIGSGNPWDVTAGSATSGTGSTSFSIPGSTTVVPNTLVVDIVSNSDATTASGWTNADLANLTERVDEATSFGNSGGIAVATGVKLLAGPYAATTGSMSASTRQARLTIALKPADNAPVWKRPMGERWGHTYTTWIDDASNGGPTKIILHTNRGQDILMNKTSSDATWEYFTPQTGVHFKEVKRRLASPNETQIKQLTGEVTVYNSSGRLTEIWDTLQTPNKVLVAYDGNGQVSTVTDASGKRRLLFAYTSGLLYTVSFQIYVSGAWTTYHSTSYGYNNGSPTTVTIGGNLAQINTYVDGYLREIDDGGYYAIAKFAYDGAVAGKIVRVDTGRGVVGWDYNSSRSNCSGKTVLYFNKGNTTSCNVDSDCGSGFLCGGKSGSGSTGTCFRAARCLTISSPSEDVITNVAALGPPGESCDGACLDVLSYTWNTTFGAAPALDLKATEDPSNKFITKTFDGNGMPTKIVYGDADSDPTSGGTREVYLYYNSAYPGRLAEVRRKSDLSSSRSSCSASNTTGCARTLYTYNADGMLSTVEEIGTTSDGAEASFDYTTTYTYNTTHKDLVASIDGPLTGSNDVTVFEYWSSTDPFKDGFLQNFKRKKDSTNYLTQSSLTFDFWGNATSVKDADNTISCMTFDSARGFLSQHRETMAGQTDCTANSADLVTSWERDANLRLTKLTRPDGSCIFYTYESMGRLETVRRRDDCVTSSAGDTLGLVYNADGLLTITRIFDANDQMKRQQELTYFDSRRLEKIINPVNTAKWTGMTYDPRGMLSEVTAVDGSTNLSKTAWTFDAEGRVSTEKRYTAGTAFDTWTLLFDWIGNQEKVTDGDSKVTESVRDDVGRMVKLINPDLGGYPTLRVYDAASRLTSLKESFGSGSQQNHSFTFDNLGRPLDSDYAGTCPTGTQHPEIQRVYDDEPSGTCPTGMSCTGTEGRLAYVKVTLYCSNAYSGTDGALDQETWYQYDGAGRLIREYIKDDSGSRTADHQFTWTKNGTLSQVTTPSGAVLGATFGSAGNNSDTDRITALWRTSTSTPIIDNVKWFPFGPLQQFNQMNSYAGHPIRTRIARNLAYRITDIGNEHQDDTNAEWWFSTEEDAKGRVNHRSYWPLANLVTPSYFIYDQSDRVLCEANAAISSCPTSGSTIKNVHSASPPFTAAGDWKQLLRPIPGSTGLTHDFTLTTGTHQIQTVNQSDGTPTLGRISFGYDSRGNRSYEDDIDTLTYDRRDYTYDARRNLINVRGRYPVGGGTWHYYDVASAFDAQNRRVFKSFIDETTGQMATWFFYYDANDRLVEMRYTPNTSDSSTYSVVQFFWLGDRIVLQWQTDYPSATTSKKYFATDETGRPMQTNRWLSDGSYSWDWQINPSAWGMDTNVRGPTVFQPFLFAGQYQDVETVALQNDGATMHRPSLALNGYRTYDPFTGAYLQVDPLVDSTWSTYVYANGDPVNESDTSGLSTNETPRTQKGEVIVIIDTAPEEPDYCFDYGMCWPGGSPNPPAPPTGGGGGGNGVGPGGGPVSDVPTTVLCKGQSDTDQIPIKDAAHENRCSEYKDRTSACSCCCAHRYEFAVGQCAKTDTSCKRNASTNFGFCLVVQCEIGKKDGPSCRASGFCANAQY